MDVLKVKCLNMNAYSYYLIVLSSFFFVLVCCGKELDGVPLKQDPALFAKAHPFLIVKKSEFNALRAKSAREPWLSMKEDAIRRSNAGTKSGGAYDLQDFVGAAALAYILDESNAALHANRVRDAIVNQYSKLKVQDGGGWGGVVPNMGSFFMAILSLDIVYDALDPVAISDCEAVISDQIFKISREGSWVDVRYGTHGTWDIYKGIRTTPDDKYYQGIMRQITPDGVSPVTIHYAWERVGGGNSRLSKSGYMDVLEYTGIDQRYYENERIQKFQRWLFGSSVNCSREMAIIGDMLPTQTISNDMLHRRVGNFDSEAAGYAAWFHHDVPAQGNILTYILPKAELPDPVTPSSQWYENGGAFFREAADNANGLHLVLYNIKTQDEWHTHNEVNGLALSGYGNRLLVNGGRLGEPTRAANLNNTLTINGENHATRVGGGIKQAFTSDQLDFAAGDAGPALPGKGHMRNVFLIHADDGTRPYCILLDEVSASAGDQIISYLHPANESSVQVQMPQTKYTAKIDHYPTVDGTQLTIYYATPPAKVEIEKVQSAVEDRYPGYPRHNRLASSYEADAEGEKNIFTVLVPGEQSFSEPNIERIDLDHSSGCQIGREGDGWKDLILASNGKEEVRYDSVAFLGKTMFSRHRPDAQSFYFVKEGSHFLRDGLGFESDVPVTIFVGERNGRILSDGAEILLMVSDPSALKFDSKVDLEVLSKNRVRVKVPKGQVAFTL